MKPKLRPPNFRRLLIKINTDIITLDQALYGGYWPEQLCTLDILVVLLEDRRYFRHLGIDIKSFAREILRAATFQRHGGASTSDMEFVRTITGYKDRTISRKLYESALSIVMHFRYSKMQILRAYMREAYFGWNIIGFDQLSWNEYEKPFHELGLEESSRLAAMLVYPKPRLETPAWRQQVDRRAKYGVILYARHKKRLDKLDIGK